MAAGDVKELIDARLRQLEERVDEHTGSESGLEIREIAVAPRSKLRVACE